MSEERIENTADVVEEATEATEVQEEQAGFNIDMFNKYFESDIDEGSLKSLIANRDKYSNYDSEVNSYKEKLESFSKYKQDYEDLIDQFDGSKLFANENIRKLNQMLKKYPDKDPSIVSSVLGLDISQASPGQLLVMADKLNNPITGVTDADRLEGILDVLGLHTDDVNELEGKDRYKLQKALNDAKKAISEVRDYQVEDQGFDVEAAKQKRADELSARKDALTKGWTPAIQRIVKEFEGITSIPIKNEKGEVIHEYKYTTDDSFKDQVLPIIREELIDSGLDTSEENIQLAGQEVMRRFVLSNFSKIVSDAYKQGATAQKEEAHRIQHNDKPTNTAQNPAAERKTKGKTLSEMIKNR